MRASPVIILLLIIGLSGCAVADKSPNLGGLYNHLAQHETPDRNPVVLIPGLMGSKLRDNSSGAVVWGAFGPRGLDPNSGDGARLFAVPMEEGKKLADLRDDVRPDGALDRMIVDFWGLPFEQQAYAQILGALGVGGYRDQDLAEAGLVDWGDQHFTCFQFDYDWRRDIVESAREFDRFIQEKRRYVQQGIEKRFGIENYDVKFDIVAHSMGGLVARYYLRYGAADLPADGSLPQVTWAGRRFVENVVIIGTPNAGSIEALLSLVNGYRPAMLLPSYSPAVLGTLPSLYQLLPRSRHRPLLDETGRPVQDIFAPDLWRRYGWGLADESQDRQRSFLLPKIETPARRRQIALEHQQKVLKRAKQFTDAMDTPAERPASLKYFLMAGDAEETWKTAQIGPDGSVKIIKKGPGDSVVLRSSALMDERPQDYRFNRLKSPIQWNQVIFIFADHVALTKVPAFTDNLLYILLESQRI